MPINTMSYLLTITTTIIEVLNVVIVIVVSTVDITTTKITLNSQGRHSHEW
jgi:hypothetical protein